MSPIRKLTVVLAGALTVLTACSHRTPEPTYQGRAFSQWYKAYAEATDRSDAQAKARIEEARRAMKELAPQIVPILLKDLRAQIEKGTEPPIPPTCVFVVLGPDAAAAVSDLEAMISQLPAANPADPEAFGRLGGARKDIAYCLSVIGDPAIPCITKLLSHPQAQTRYQTAYQFGAQLEFGDSFTQGTNLLQTIPPLIKCTEDEDPYTAVAAISCLAAIKMQPAETVPALQKALRSPKAEVRKEAEAALAKIASRQ